MVFGAVRSAAAAPHLPGLLREEIESAVLGVERGAMIMRRLQLLVQPARDEAGH
jgi:hypothetical protein